MVERLATILGGLDKDTEIVRDLLLPREIVKIERAERILKVFLLVALA